MMNEAAGDRRAQIAPRTSTQIAHTEAFEVQSEWEKKVQQENEDKRVLQ